MNIKQFGCDQSTGRSINSNDKLIKSNLHYYLKTKLFFLRSGIAFALLSGFSPSSFAVGYTVSEIPIPAINIPAGKIAYPVCLSINEVGKVACTLEIRDGTLPSQLDRLSPKVKIFASYAYLWDRFNTTRPVTLLSPTPINPNQLDRAYAINDNCLIAGSSDTTLLKKPQGIMWSCNGSFTTFGSGAITDINNPGDYVQKGNLILNTNAIGSFPTGSQQTVHSINNLNSVTTYGAAAGIQSFNTKTLRISGTGLLNTNTAITPLPVYALATTSNVAVTDLNDVHRYTISGVPQTSTGVVGFSCIDANNCRAYVSRNAPPPGRVIPWLTLNAVDNSGRAVGTDSGVAYIFPPRPVTVNATLPPPIDLNGQLQPGDFSVRGWFLGEALDINERNEIVGLGQKGGRWVAFLLTPAP
jgi:hypothetical protein